MFPLQVFEEGETSKTFKAGGAKSFEGGRGEEVGGGARVQVVPVQPWAAAPPLASVTSSLAPELNPPKHHLHQGRGKMHQR